MREGEDSVPTNAIRNVVHVGFLCGSMEWEICGREERGNLVLVIGLTYCQEIPI
jgi:hypothetical protein